MHLGRFPIVRRHDGCQNPLRLGNTSGSGFRDFYGFFVDFTLVLGGFLRIVHPLHSLPSRPKPRSSGELPVDRLTESDLQRVLFVDKLLGQVTCVGPG